MFDRSHGINFQSVSDSIIERVHIVDFYFDGVYLGPSIPDRYVGGVPDPTSGSNRNIVRDCGIVRVGRNGISITHGTDNLIDGNILVECNKNAPTWIPDPEHPELNNPFGAGAIDIEAHATWRDLSRNIITRNRILHGYFNGIQINGQNWDSGIIVSSNIIHGMARHAIAAVKVSHLVISGNYVANSKNGMALGQGTPGIRDTAIVGNVVHGNEGSGILLNGPEGARITVTGNVCVENGIHAIACEPGQGDAPHQVVMVGNIAYKEGADAGISNWGADPVYAANLTGALGVPPKERRYAWAKDIFGQYWRMYGDDSGLYVENQKTGQSYRVQLEQLP